MERVVMSPPIQMIALAIVTAAALVGRASQSQSQILKALAFVEAFLFAYGFLVAYEDSAKAGIALALALMLLFVDTRVAFNKVPKSN